jgi:hypothetical protein
VTAGEVIAAGRDCEILDYGPGKVLRRPFDGRSLAVEGEVMGYARERGLPVPEYFGEADGGIVVERVEGPTMLDAMVRKPLLRMWGRELAGLHARVHAVEAPSVVTSRATPEGDRLIHGDLHPLNVLMSPKGPVIIDWPNASAGEPGFDLALAWVIMATSDITEPQPVRAVAGGFRKLFVRHFVNAAGRSEARRFLRVAGDRRRADPHVTASERARVEALVRRTLEA